MRKFLVVLAMAAFANLAQAEEHIIEMKNIGADGPMVFEPAITRAAVGDTVKFVLTNPAHNSSSIEGLIPEGATPWSGAINQEITVTLDAEGVYAYICTPHTVMAMVGVIVAGEPTNLDDVKANMGNITGQFMANQDRLEKYLNEI